MNIKIGNFELDRNTSYELYHQMEEYFKTERDEALSGKYLNKNGVEGFNERIAQRILDSEGYEILDVGKDDHILGFLLKKRSDDINSAATGPVFFLELGELVECVECVELGE